MKKRYAVIVLSAALGLSLLHGCGGTDQKMQTKSAAFRDQEEDNAVYGEVSQVTESSLIIKTGTRKKMEMPQGEMPEEMPEPPQGETPEASQGEVPEPPQGEVPELPQGEMPELPQGEIPSMLELTGEEQEIKVTEDTVIKREKISKGSGTEEMEKKEETIKIGELSEGDIVRAVLAQDGHAEEIIVMSGGGPEGGRNQSSQPESQNVL